ncbi:MAG: Phospho-N-acetylmuramoyl-pentapeptide-transferase [Thermotoga sp. 50_1627]|uniref:phospho-N-acetylmuramoyl-pentapeptide- transferase n=1 Tax=Pseudothermotoga sp. TaxID=2033661 RepID=UPI00076BC47E|nr:MAG: Phospho-N-acetylmuramoyl-pentapeptide-transferase [Thermotoga sp. 50_64]KUK25812.1 MAG: Phospho-N-acetylmuramoyl-pentapeptide-transferase [Thermotoga sp. 50_1627]MBC7115497.1 phospho-N-acetylmuramoyl-pentapeptide-transferase [Pseudothermotoga sp.]MDK2922885.1 phospho-N-acetylmuramoyl-pentapeptide-transferase [Pseudothermotoga sp.]HBT40085.1 phospho-N-acetylmuramoyl-pentapeptide-transferase [Pseudothermotoga sp.]
MKYFAITFLPCAVLYPFLIRLFKRLRVGQFIREEGPDLHGYKTGTPTMGGLLFSIFGAVSCLVFGYTIDGLAIVLFSLIGFLDDLLSVIKKTSLGLRAWQKFSLQIIFATVLLILIRPDTKLQIPFLQKDLDLGRLYWIFAVLLIAGLSNATNLTDGLDGLATSVFLTSAIPYWFLLGKSADSLILFSLCLMAFLFYNIKPAKMFMGDTGSLALGALIAVVSIRTSTEIIALLCSSIFVVEALSVVIQVSSYKLFKKRVFKMSPIHHHFELLGWSEERIVQMFALANLTVSMFVLLGGKAL